MRKSKQISEANPNILCIIDEKTKFLFPKFTKESIVSSETDLDKIDFDQRNFSAIIVLAELEWNDKYVQHFHGLEIATQLRRKYKLLYPIIIVSTFPQNWFEKKAEEEIKYQILFGRGTAFLHVEEIEDKLGSTIQSFSPLNEAVLTDLNEMLLDQKGFLIDQLTHDLKPGMESETLNQTMNEAGAYLNQKQKASLNWFDFKKQLLETRGNTSDFSNVKEDLLLKCEQNLVGPGKPSSDDPPEKRHKVVFLEDDLQFAKKTEEKLKGHFSEFIVTDSSKEAIRLIDEDDDNTISGIIADWRLYSDQEHKYWQLQGYEVLEYAAKNHMIALFSLTSLSDRNVNNIRNMLGLDIHLFKKSHLLGAGDGQWDMMADTIKQKCDEVLELISSQPTGSKWSNFKEEYIKKRNSDWETFQNDIASEASRIYDYYYEEAVMNENSRNVYGIGEMGLSLKNDLMNTLITRRVYLGLYFTLTKENKYLQAIRPSKLLGEGDNFDTELKHHSIDTYSLLRKDWWEDISTAIDSVQVEDEWSKFEQRMKNLRSSLCIELSVLPGKGILPEEKNWLSKNNIDYSFLFNYW